MRILILGDFSGKGIQRVAVRQAFGEHVIHRIDINNFDAVMARIAPRLRLRLDTDVELAFRQMEDFHPDALFQNLEIFQGLARIRERLNADATFSQAAEELRSLMQVAVEDPAAEQAPSKAEDDQATFARLLGGSAVHSTGSHEDRVKSVTANTIGRLVAQYIVPDPPPYKDIYLKAVDEALGAKMRKLLHQPDFQALEAIWRALWTLVSNLETGENLSLHLLDIGKDELYGEVNAAAENLSGSALYRLLVGQNVGTFGGKPWSLVIGNFTFGSGPEDIAMLAACGLLASQAGGPFIAAADPGLLGCRALAESPDPHDWPGMPPDAEKRWAAFRQTPLAPWIGLVLPRILLRLPYGRDSDPLESFAFEEAVPPYSHEDFLWGNPAFFCALLLGRSYLERGDAMLPGDDLEIHDLPAYILKQDDGAKLLPSAEVYLNDRAMDKIMCLGIMPFLSHRNGNIARLARFQSLADPVAALRGFWSD
ncbi:MAG: type VI secretion system contractile sheath domain-containing protein [Methylomicrobium sp.]